jgi:hypothetical protein
MYREIDRLNMNRPLVRVNLPLDGSRDKATTSIAVVDFSIPHKTAVRLGDFRQILRDDKRAWHNALDVGNVEVGHVVT